MTDYLITRYNEVISASRAKMESAIAGATTIYNSACAEIISAWQADAVAAAIELQTAMNARDRAYIQGPPLLKSPRTEVDVEAHQDCYQYGTVGFVKPGDPETIGHARLEDVAGGEPIRIDSAA